MQDKAQHKEAAMFIDTVVLAGIGTVALMVAFFGGVGLFIWKDSHKKAKATTKAE